MEEWERIWKSAHKQGDAPTDRLINPEEPDGKSNHGHQAATNGTIKTIQV